MSFLCLVVKIWLIFVMMSAICPKSDGEMEQWCVADEQTPDEVLQMGTDWACGHGANCSTIQDDQQPCYYPNTTRAHASHAFNSYFQNTKNNGGSCYFHGAAMVTDLDPSYSSCRYEFLPRS